MPQVDTSVLSEAREHCQKAKDTFFNCVTSSGKSFSAATPTLISKCKKQRESFESACKPSWVKHFDQTFEKQKILQAKEKAQTSKPPDTAVLKKARGDCHKARDSFYSCVESTKEEFTPENPTPPECKQQRRAFEAACKASWVKHFDAVHDKKLKFIKKVQGNIAIKADTSAGNLSGKSF